MAGLCGTIDRIGARGRTGTGDKGGGVRGNSKRVGVRFWDAEEEEEEGGVVMVVVISCSVLENNAQNFDGDK